MSSLKNCLLTLVGRLLSGPIELPAHLCSASHRQWFQTVLLFCAVAVSCSAGAQQTSSSARSTPSLNEVSETLHDPLGRTSPRGAFTGYIEAISEEDYTKAAAYLDIAGLHGRLREAGGAVIAQRLRAALDRDGNVTPTISISDEPSGDLNDGLQEDMERIGTISVHGETVPLYLERTKQPDEPLWRISSETLSLLPTAVEQAESTVNELLPNVLVQRRWHGVPVGQWLAMLVLAVAAFASSRLLVAAATGGAR
ncbi:hypothetical protein KXR94_16180 [Stutzerimonas stutzeri]